MKLTQEELNQILENHKHWLNEDCEGWEKMKADLRDADLSYADLRDADLSYANLRDADLSDANLRDADLSYANLSAADLRDTNLSGANLRDTNLCYANLSGADLRGANLSGANLRGSKLSEADLRDTNLSGANLRDTNLCYANLSYANLSEADLRDTNLCYANLCDADLRDTNLSGANLSGANLHCSKNFPFIPYACPENGSFVGYKKANGYIVELKILKDARRCSATGRKCRCDKAKVLSIQNLDGTIADITEIASDYTKNFVYKVGEIVEEPDFCEDRWKECSKGIHFFINRQETVKYQF